VSLLNKTVIRFQAKKQQWEETSLSIILECGHSDIKHIPRNPHHLYRRQPATSSTSRYQVATGVIPSGTPTSTSKSVALANTITDKLLQVAGFQGTIRCKTCNSHSSFNLTDVVLKIGGVDKNTTFTVDMEFELSTYAEFEVVLTTDPYHLKVPVFIGPSAGLSSSMGCNISNGYRGKWKPLLLVSLRQSKPTVNYNQSQSDRSFS